MILPSLLVTFFQGVAWLGLQLRMLRLASKFSLFLFRGVAEAALYCAHRTSTFLSCAFCEQEGHLATPSRLVDFFSILLSCIIPLLAIHLRPYFMHHSLIEYKP